MTNSSVHALLWHTLSKVPKSPWELVQLYPSVTPPRTSVCKEMLLLFFFLSVPPAIPHICFARVSKVRAVSYPSSEVTAVWKCGAPRQSAVDWLWLPRETHSPHNNELLRLPEDTVPAWRIEIKRQVREVRWRRRAVGGGGEANTGGNEFSIRQMWDASLAGMHEEILPRCPNALSKCP